MDEESLKKMPDDALTTAPSSTTTGNQIHIINNPLKKNILKITKTPPPVLVNQ